MASWQADSHCWSVTFSARWWSVWTPSSSGRRSSITFTELVISTSGSLLFWMFYLQRGPLLLITYKNIFLLLHRLQNFAFLFLIKKPILIFQGPNYNYWQGRADSWEDNQKKENQGGKEQLSTSNVSKPQGSCLYGKQKRPANKWSQ